MRVSSLCVNFWRNYASLWTQNIGNVKFSALFFYMLWHNELKFCIWLSFNVVQIKFECHQFASIFEEVMPLCELRLYEMLSFSALSPTCFDILSRNVAYDFVFDKLQINFECRHFASIFKEFCLFLILDYRKCEVFCTFLLHALRYWDEILHMWLCFNDLQIKFKCCLSASVWLYGVGARP